MSLIDPGQPAPPFSLRDQDGKTHTLKDYAGRPLVLYFYPKDDTSICTTEACQFRDALPRFGQTPVLGVSPDDQASHKAFADKHKLGFPLLADSKHNSQGRPEVSDAYGAWGSKSMYGRQYEGVIRTTYLIDAEGNIAKRWDDVRVRGHAQEVLAALGLLERGELKDGQPAEGAHAPPRPRKGGRPAHTAPAFGPVRGEQGPAAGLHATPPRAGSGRAQKGS